MWLNIDDQIQKARLTLSAWAWKTESPVSTSLFLCVFLSLNSPTYPNETQLVFYRVLLSLRIRKQDGR